MGLPGQPLPREDNVSLELDCGSYTALSHGESAELWVVGPKARG